MVEVTVAGRNLRLIGRALACVSILGLATILSLLIPSVNQFFTGFGYFGLLGMVTFAATSLAWGLALYHWGRHYRGSRETLWVIVLVLGGVVGMWSYWLFAAREERKSRPAL